MFFRIIYGTLDDGAENINDVILNGRMFSSKAMDKNKIKIYEQKAI